MLFSMEILGLFKFLLVYAAPWVWHMNFRQNQVSFACNDLKAGMSDEILPFAQAERQISKVSDNSILTVNPSTLDCVCKHLLRRFLAAAAAKMPSDGNITSCIDKAAGKFNITIHIYLFDFMADCRFFLFFIVCINYIRLCICNFWLKIFATIVQTLIYAKTLILKFCSKRAREERRATEKTRGKRTQRARGKTQKGRGQTR